MIRIEDIEDKVKDNYPKSDLKLIRKAYVFSAQQHAGQIRKNGQPYLSHPLEVAYILADMGLDEIAVAVGLLHDVVEDTIIDIDTIEKHFGKTAANIVDGVTKISQIPFKSTEHKQAENFRKLLLAMASDIRVILVKLADRLHNMRTLQYLTNEQKKRIAKETLDIYVPIANRLGMGKIKGELEDLAFSYLEPEKYQETVALIESRRVAGEKSLSEIEEKLKSLLDDTNIPVEFQSRIKRVFSIYTKLTKQKIAFDEVYDFLAVRAITESVQDCYAILGIAHSKWKIVPGRFKDFISLPRPNGYQSIHTTLMTENGVVFELQIRTHEMHKIAEEGIAAHWKYKEGKYTNDETDERFTWLRHVLEWQKEVDNPHQFIANLKIDLYPEEVYVFTPNGDVITLPKGATPLDFAYAIHTEVGNHCAQAKVHNRIVPLKYQIKNGDVVEIITSKDRHPSRDWLSFVKTTKAKSKIRYWLNQQEKKQAIIMGKRILEKESLKFKKSLKSIQNHPDFDEKLNYLGLNSIDDLFTKIGYGKISAHSFMENLLQSKLTESTNNYVEPITEKVKNVLRKGSGKFLVHGLNDVLITRAKCCNPIPGDEIIGYISRGRGIIVHSLDCKNVENLMVNPEKQIEVTWARQNRGETYTVNLLVYTEDRKGILADITNRISGMNVNIKEFGAQSMGSQKGIINISIDVTDKKQLNKIIRIIKSIKDVQNVERTQEVIKGRTKLF